MSKIMVVEDDASLREIYSIRITAEGYEVVSAGDGEEALAVAVREKPDLILSDVMMPKISGFDMLDILRSTPETASIKVVMMTALSAEDQRQRGERLGADRYLVKSQVGIEDVINTIHEVLGDREVPEVTTESVVTPAAPSPEPLAAPSSDSLTTPTPLSAPATPSTPTVAPAPASNPVPPLPPTPVSTPAPSSMPETPSLAPETPSAQPIPGNQPTAQPALSQPQVNNEQPAA